MVFLHEGSDHSVPQERGAIGHVAEEGLGVREVAVGGDGDEGDEFSGCERVGNGARDGEVGLDLLGVAHCEAWLVQEGEDLVG